MKHRTIEKFYIWGRTVGDRHDRLWLAGCTSSPQPQVYHKYAWKKLVSNETMQWDILVQEGLQGFVDSLNSVFGGSAYPYKVDSRVCIHSVRPSTTIYDVQRKSFLLAVIISFRVRFALMGAITYDLQLGIVKSQD